MFDEPQHRYAANAFQNFEEEKVCLPNEHIHFKLQESPKLQKKRTKTSIMDGQEKGRASRGIDVRNANQNFGHWTIEENKRYHWFLEIHHHHFLNKHMRRMDKIFKTMALFVSSREAEQCRSHHQKMEKKFKHSICEILLHLRELHYQTYNLAPLLDDIRTHAVPLKDSLLNDQFLLQRREGEFKDEANLNKQPEVQHRMEESFELYGEEERKYEQEGQSRMELAYQVYSQKSLVDSLFEVDAPHNNFQMI